MASRYSRRWFKKWRGRVRKELRAQHHRRQGRHDRYWWEVPEHRQARIKQFFAELHEQDEQLMLRYVEGEG